MKANHKIKEFELPKFIVKSRPVLTLEYGNKLATHKESKLSASEKLCCDRATD